MSTLQCCCEPVIPCGGGWPKVLSYAGSVGQSQAGFYFVNQALTLPEPVYTLTWQDRPAGIPLDLQLEYFNQPGGIFPPYYITMPDAAWFSDPIPILLFGNPGHFCYFYLWMHGCSAHVMIIDMPYAGTYGDSGAVTEGAGNLIHTYITPTHLFGDNPTLPAGADFGMEPGPFNGPIVVWGTRGSDDIIPDESGSAGQPGSVRHGP